MSARDPEREAEAAVEEVLEPDEVRRRAGAGAVVVATRGLVINLLGLAGGIVLARLLLPRDFGVVAVGAAIVGLSYFLADAGVGATLIRNRDAPARRDLEALLAFQLLVCSLFAAAIAAVAWRFGEVGQVTALMAALLPFAAFRTPGLILLERALSYRPIAIVEVSEVVAYYGWAVATVLAGWGVWGLASAAVVRAVAGSALMVAVAPARLLRPRPSWARTRRLLGFGLRYQALGATIIARDLGLGLGTAALGGVPVLGLWTLARRLLDVPFLLLTTLWRVSFPAMSRLVAAGEEPRPIVEQAVRLVATGLGVLLVPLVGSAPALVPALLGARWAEAADVLPWAGLGLMISGPISVAASGFLWAVGDARTPLRATILDALTWCLVALPLVPVLGLPALGVGWLAAALAQSVVLARSVQRRTGATVAAALGVPTLVGACAATAGWVVASAFGDSAASAALSALLAEGLYLGGLFLVARQLLRETLVSIRRALQASVSGSPADAR